MKRYITATLRVLGGLTILLLILNTVGCHASKSATAVTSESATCSAMSASLQDSTVVIAAGCDSILEDAAVRSAEQGEIEIVRDSVGNPVRIFWNRLVDITSQTNRRAEQNQWFYGLNATRYSEAVSKSDTTKETTKETSVESTNPLKGMALLLLGVVLSIAAFVLLSRYLMPWLQNRIQ